MQGRKLAHPDYQQILVRGTPVRFMRAGQGKPLLLIRGDDASEGWRDYMHVLSQGNDVIVPEHPGFGGAAKPEWLDCAADMANFYLDLSGQLGLQDFSLMGLGLGGWIAAEMAIRAKGGLANLTLVDAAGLRIDGVEDIDLFLRNEEQGILEKFADPLKAQAELAYKLTPESEDIRIANQMVVAQLAWSPRWHDPALRKWLHRIIVPALIVWGDQDRIFPVAHAHEWQKLIMGSRVEIVAGSGHMPYIEQPELFIKAVSGFINAERVPA